MRYPYAIILILCLFVQTFALASEPFCGLNFPLTGSRAALTPQEYLALKKQKTPQDIFVPGYSEDHLFFVEKNAPRKFLVLQYRNADLGDEAHQVSFKNRETAAVLQSYAGLTQTSKSESLRQDLKGFYIEYNMVSSPQVATRFQYYFINATCALVAIFSVTPESETAQLELKSGLEEIIKSQPPSPKPAAVPEKKRKSLLEILVKSLVDTAILGVACIFIRFVLSKIRKPEKAAASIKRRILARGIDGFASGILWTLLIGILTDVVLLDELKAFQLMSFVFGGFLLALTFAVSRYGQSPGRFVLNIKVVDSVSEKNPAFWRVLVRDIPFYLLWGFCTFIFINLETLDFMLGRQKAAACPSCGSYFAFWGAFVLFQLVDFLCALLRNDKRTIRDLASHVKVIRM